LLFGRIAVCSLFNYLDGQYYLKLAAVACK